MRFLLTRRTTGPDAGAVRGRGSETVGDVSSSSAGARALTSESSTTGRSGRRSGMRSAGGSGGRSGMGSALASGGAGGNALKLRSNCRDEPLGVADASTAVLVVEADTRLIELPPDVEPSDGLARATTSGLRHKVAA